jgi:hypothetical protein
VIRGRGGPGKEVARAYGGVLVTAAAFLVMAAAVNPIDRPEQRVAAGTARGVLAPGPSGGPPVIGQLGEDGPLDRGPSDDGDGPSSRSDDSDEPAGTVSACADRSKQVAGDPYSPPCVDFQGDNGGATWRGVTEDEIVVAVRELEGPSAAEIFADLSGQAVITTREAVHDTLLALAEYFSNRFQFYGRKLKLVFYGGQGHGASELLGSGQERALADAVKVAKEIKAFADLSGITTPYADALSRQEVVNIGAPYPSQQWFVDRRPYAWSNFPDGTVVVDSVAAWAKARLVPDPVVRYTPELNGQKRVIGVVGPENPEYQGSGDRFGQGLGAENIKISLNYRIDIATMPNQASNIIAQLKNAGVTTVLCFCDPVMLALGMAPKAIEQNYNPEWVTGGLAFVEQDIVGQLIDAEQWQHAFGLAFNAESEPLGRSFPVAAYRSVRPGGEPAFGVAEAYYQFYQLALGIMLAGPNLTPETFEAGMFSYPPAVGPRGTWHFGPGDYTSTDDFREIWWAPDRISGQNGNAGTWIELNGGARWTTTRPPSGPARYFDL